MHCGGCAGWHQAPAETEAELLLGTYWTEHWQKRHLTSMHAGIPLHVTQSSLAAELVMLTKRDSSRSLQEDP